MNVTIPQFDLIETIREMDVMIKIYRDKHEDNHYSFDLYDPEMDEVIWRDLVKHNNKYDAISAAKIRMVEL